MGAINITNLAYQVPGGRDAVQGRVVHRRQRHQDGAGRRQRRRQDHAVPPDRRRRQAARGQHSHRRGARRHAPARRHARPGRHRPRPAGEPRRARSDGGGAGTDRGGKGAGGRPVGNERHAGRPRRDQVGRRRRLRTRDRVGRRVPRRAAFALRADAGPSADDVVRRRAEAARPRSAVPQRGRRAAARRARQLPRRPRQELARRTAPRDAQDRLLRHPRSPAARRLGDAHRHARSVGRVGTRPRASPPITRRARTVRPSSTTTSGAGPKSATGSSSTCGP